MAAGKEGREKFFYYDVVGGGLMVLSAYFFFQSIELARDQNYVAGIIAALIGGFIFSGGIGLIKVSAAAKVAQREGPKSQL
jgi:hypothetical protein